MKTRLLVIRHGQSMSNVYGTFTGRGDYELSPLGKQQAEITAEYLKNEKADAFYSSSLIRAYHTAKTAAKFHNNAEIKINDGLLEIYAGKWEGEKFTDLMEKYPKEYGLWKKDIGNSRPMEGESPKEVCERVYNAMEEIAKENIGKTVIVATHAMALRCFATKVLWNDVSKMQDLPWASNASVSEFEYENNNFTLIEYSHDEHLGEMKTELPKTV